MSTGPYIRISSILTLKKHFTYTVTKLEQHELIETGLYRNIQHPGYLGQLIIFLGIAISMSNWLSVLGMMLPVTTGFLYKPADSDTLLITGSPTPPAGP